MFSNQANILLSVLLFPILVTSAEFDIVREQDEIREIVLRDIIVLLNNSQSKHDSLYGFPKDTMFLSYNGYGIDPTEEFISRFDDLGLNIMKISKFNEGHGISICTRNIQWFKKDSVFIIVEAYKQQFFSEQYFYILSYDYDNWKISSRDLNYYHQGIFDQYLKVKHRSFFDQFNLFGYSRYYLVIFYIIALIIFFISLFRKFTHKFLSKILSTSCLFLMFAYLVFFYIKIRIMLNQIERDILVTGEIYIKGDYPLKIVSEISFLGLNFLIITIIIIISVLIFNFNKYRIQNRLK